MLPPLMLNQMQEHSWICIHLPAKNLSIQEELGLLRFHIMDWKVGQFLFPFLTLYIQGSIVTTVVYKYIMHTQKCKNNWKWQG